MSYAWASSTWGCSKDIYHPSWKQNGWGRRYLRIFSRHKDIRWRCALKASYLWSTLHPCKFKRSCLYFSSKIWHFSYSKSMIVLPSLLQDSSLLNSLEDGLNALLNIEVCVKSSSSMCQINVAAFYFLHLIRAEFWMDYYPETYFVEMLGYWSNEVRDAIMLTYKS